MPQVMPRKIVLGIIELTSVLAVENERFGVCSLMKKSSPTNEGEENLREVKRIVLRVQRSES